jgi:hypothetical protein
MNAVLDSHSRYSPAKGKAEHEQLRKGTFGTRRHGSTPRGSVIAWMKRMANGSATRPTAWLVSLWLSI